jgi:hypothetical protein
MRFGIPSAGMVGKQGVAATVSSRLVCQPCFICQLLHHCVNASLLLCMHACCTCMRACVSAGCVHCAVQLLDYGSTAVVDVMTSIDSWV